MSNRVCSLKLEKSFQGDIIKIFTFENTTPFWKVNNFISIKSSLESDKSSLLNIIRAWAKFKVNLNFEIENFIFELFKTSKQKKGFSLVDTKKTASTSPINLKIKMRNSEIISDNKVTHYA